MTDMYFKFNFITFTIIVYYYILTKFSSFNLLTLLIICYKRKLKSRFKEFKMKMSVLMLLLIFWKLNNATFTNTTVVPLELLPFLYLSNKEDTFSASNMQAEETENDVGDVHTSDEAIRNDHENEVQTKYMNSKITKKESDRKPVKLTMKQGLIMNQIINAYALENVENELCKNHTREFKTGLRAFETWALQMFDSSSKMQAGILLGNLVDFGSFSQCLKIYRDTEFGPIYGKHCLLQMKLSKQLLQKILSFHNISEKRFEKVYVSVEKSYPGWSVCVPHSCPTEDILRHFNKTIMDLAEGLDIVITLKERHCNSVLNQPVMGKTQYIILSCLSIFIVLGLTAAVIDFDSNEESDNIFVDIFSALKNMRRVLREGTGKKEMDFIHGLRIFSSCSVVLGHRYIMYIMYPVINQMEELDWIVQLSSTLVLGSTITVDSFFMTSGMLVSIGFFEYVTKTGSFNILLFYLHRYLRITLPLAIVIIFYVSTVQFLGSGPLQEYVYTNHQKPCQDYWWSALLHIQAYINPTPLCIYQNWYLSTDMTFFFFSPVILYPLWKWPKFGYFNIVFWFCLATISSFYYAYKHKYNGEILPVTNQLFQTEYFTKYYIQPHIRAATYIIGLGFGYFIVQTRDRKFKVGKWLNISLWMISLAVMGTTVFCSGIFYLESHDYNRLETSVFLALSRSAWTVGVVWIMWSCMHGYGGIVNDFLSAHAFKVLGRITYAIFLLHSIVQLYKNAAGKAPLTFSNMNVIYDAFADLFLVFIIAFLFTIFYELPLIRMEALIFNPRSKKVSPSQAPRS